MTDSRDQNSIVNDLIDREKWEEFLQRFIEVLKINIFVVDHKGRVVIPPFSSGGPTGRYGSQFLTSTFGFDFSGQKANIVEDFEQQGSYLEMRDPLDLHIFAIPIKVEGEKIIAYLMVGPVILGKRWKHEDYLNIANQLDEGPGELIGVLDEIRVVSFVTMKAILELLAGVAKDIVELNLERKKLRLEYPPKEILSQKIAEAAQDLYATIHLDELLITILDVALKLTDAECGSIMVLDKESQDLTIKVSRGIQEQQVVTARLHMGEGIAGLAAEKNKSFLIVSGEQNGEEQLKPLLKRPDIKQAAVIPLVTRNRVFGVLNVHSKKDKNKIAPNMENLRSLCKVISTVIP